jgi:hypothetical protein
MKDNDDAASIGLLLTFLFIGWDNLLVRIIWSQIHNENEGRLRPKKRKNKIKNEISRDMLSKRHYHRNRKYVRKDGCYLWPSDY